MMVLDAVGPKLRRVTTSGAVTTIAGSGVTGFADGALVTSRFDLPQDVCLDNSGNIYIGDRNNNRIRRIIAEPPPCTANAGSLAAVQATVCLADGGATLVATPAGDAVVPNGFSTLFVLTRTNDLIIEQLSTSSAFVVGTADTWRIHTLVYDPNTLDLSGVQFGTTEAGALLPLLVQGGGSICASLDVTGAAFSTVICGGPCTALSGSMLPITDLACLQAGQAQLMAAPAGVQLIPAGYELLYVLTRTNGLIIEQVSATPAFTVSTEDVWRIHALVYQAATLDLGIVVFGTTSAYDLQTLLLQGGGSICASLNMSGAPMKSGYCEPTCTAAGTDTTIIICFTDPSFSMWAALGGDPCPGGTWTAPTAAVHADIFLPGVDAEGVYTYSVPGSPGQTTDQATLTVVLIECSGTPQPLATDKEELGQAGSITGIGAVVATARPVKAWPVPSADVVFVPFDATVGPVQLQVTDELGRQCTVPTTVANSLLRVNVAALAPGAYTLRIIRNGEQEVVRFVRSAN